MSWYFGYILAYFIFMFAIGIYYFTKIKTSDSYLIAGWNMGFGILSEPSSARIAVLPFLLAGLEWDSQWAYLDF